MLIRLLLVAAILCDVLGSGITVRAQERITDKSRHEQQISCNDDLWTLMAEEPQEPVGSFLRTPPTSHRIASSRSYRWLPTHGSKPTKQTWRKTGGLSFNPQLFSAQSRQPEQSSGKRGASPRLYYVIALRRLLC